MTNTCSDSYLHRLGKWGKFLQQVNQKGGNPRHNCLVLFAADHGISVENYSAYPPLSTYQLVNRHLSGISPVSRMMKLINRPEIIVDVGLYKTIKHKELRAHSVVPGSRSFLRGDALRADEVEQAIRIGFLLGDEISGFDFDIIGIGEIGVGNTLAAEAITCALLGLMPEQVVGEGSSGSKVIPQKIDIIVKALNHRYPNPDSYLDLLMRFGGLEIAALAGFVARMLTTGLTIILDGFVTALAALLAAMISSPTSGQIISPSLSGERGHSYLLEKLGLEAIWDWQLNYGEGMAAAISLLLMEVLIASSKG